MQPEGHAIDRGEGGDVDDRAAPGLPHGRHTRLAALPDAAHVDGHGTVPLVLGNLVEASALDVAVERGVVHEHVDTPEFVDGVLGHGLAARHVGGVERDAGDAPVGGADGLDRFGRVADIGGNHRRAFARQRLAIGAAQASPAAGDDGDLPFKL